jgi:RNA polymerase sigma factor (TIGR02999 family)
MSDITELLGKASAGDAAAAKQVYSTLYPELKRIAHSRLRHGGNRISLDTTALVHDGYLRFVQTRALEVTDRAHFLAYASKVMRSVIVDLIREAHADRRGGGLFEVTLNTQIAEASPDGNASADADEALRVHEALARLEQIEPRLATVVEMRYFAGMTEQEIADCLGVTPRTVGRDWEKARLFLYTMLKS